MMTHFDRMYIRIHKLLAAAPAPTDGGAPAIEAAIRLRSGYQLQGVLSVMNDANVDAGTEQYASGDLVRMMVPTMVSTATDPSQVNNPRFMKKILAEHFFDFDDIECVIVLHDPSLKSVPEDKPSGIVLAKS